MGASINNKLVLRAILPLLAGSAVLMMPAPEGLTPTAWRYFALFVAAMTGIATEPLPPALLGLVAVSIAAAVRLVYPTPAQSLSWALSGFANSTIWLIFAAYMFAAGYSKTGLGRRIALLLIRAMGRSTLGLGYAVAFSDGLIAPFMPSNTARSGGTIYPAIRHIPELYDSHPNSPSARKIGAYLLYTALATSCITSSMFLTGLAPNVLAKGMALKVIGQDIPWTTWFIGYAPVGLLLFALTPWLLFKIYPPEIRQSPDAPQWAAVELGKMGAATRREKTLIVLVLLALLLWIFGTKYLDATLSAVIVVCLMALTGVVDWDDIIGNAAAWNVLIWFGTLVTLANGLAESKFLAWVSATLSPHFAGHSPYMTAALLATTYYLLHYLFASITAHVSALYPVFLAVAITLPGLSPLGWALLLGYPAGVFGILNPYATGPAPIYYGSGYIPGKDFWVYGFILGMLYLLAYLLIGLPWLLWLQP
ncbi:MAG: anion permease [Acidobacteria bacterium]|nr:anion permease [Acidobacteriota bacterium]